MKNLKSNSKVFTTKFNLDDDDLVDIRGEEYLPFVQEVESVENIKVILDEDIQEPKYYRNVCYKLENLTERDAVIFYINSYGGLLDGALTLIDAIKRTPATCVAVITGMAASAASLIALECDEVFVGAYGRMLAHTARLGNSGKLSDVHDAHVFNKKFITGIFEEAYEGFLTEAEIETCLNGKEMYFDAEEISLRLQQREEYFQKLGEELMTDLPEGEQLKDNSLD